MAGQVNMKMPINLSTPRIFMIHVHFYRFDAECILIALRYELVIWIGLHAMRKEIVVNTSINWSNCQRDGDSGRIKRCFGARYTKNCFIVNCEWNQAEHSNRTHLLVKCIEDSRLF